jgi:hypothetical protein
LGRALKMARQQSEVVMAPTSVGIVAAAKAGLERRLGPGGGGVLSAHQGNADREIGRRVRTDALGAPSVAFMAVVVGAAAAFHRFGCASLSGWLPSR